MLLKNTTFHLLYTDGMEASFPLSLLADAAGNDGRTAWQSVVEGDTVTVSLQALQPCTLKRSWVHLALDHTVDPNVLTNDFTTNGWAETARFSERNNNRSLFCDFVCMENGDDTLHTAFASVDRLMTWYRFINGDLLAFQNLEDKPLPADGLRLEKLRIQIGGGTQAFLDSYIDRLCADYHVVCDKPVPTGWCSWSICYQTLTEGKVADVAEQMQRHFGHKQMNIFQLDDSWQWGNIFSSSVEPADSFPGGIAASAKKANEQGFDFGLWLAPTIYTPEPDQTADDAPAPLRRDANGEAITTLLGSDRVYTFELDNPAYLEYLRSNFQKCCAYGSVYFKLDFLIFSLYRGWAGEDFADNLITYESDYAIAVFRRAMQTIRDTVGPDRLLLACGSPIACNAGIFDASRVTPDIAVPGWEYWNRIYKCAATLLYRSFYHRKLFINDPDGMIVREYDCGDGFTTDWYEARFWATACAMSGGSILLNEIPDETSKKRLSLFEETLPPLGIAARALDLYEQPMPSVGYIPVGDGMWTCVFNAEDAIVDRALPLERLGFTGDCLVLDAWEKKVCGVFAGEMPIQKMHAHSANAYVLRPLPTEPAVVGTTGNLYMGIDTVRGCYADGVLTVTADEAIACNRQNDLLVWLPAGYTAEAETVYTDPRGSVVRYPALQVGETAIAIVR